MTSSRRRAWMVFCVLSLALSACLSPTLPMPPPDLPEGLVSADRTSITFDGTGAIPGAYVFVWNDDVGTGDIALAGRRGEYHVTLPLDLSLHDQNLFLIWQHYGKDDSSVGRFRRPSRGISGPSGPPDAGPAAPPYDGGADANAADGGDAE